jgi:Lrp/AsnC family transcriptional regulator
VFDAHDRQILRAIQLDSDRTIQDIADLIGLSATPTARRIKRLTDEGVIKKSVTLLDPEALGLDATLFIFVRTSHHDAEWLEDFATGVQRMPEVVEFYRMSGDVDYLIKLCLPDIRDYDAFYKKLIAIAPLSDVSASFAMEAIKNTTELPV